MERSRTIFGNDIAARDYAKAVKQKALRRDKQKETRGFPRVFHIISTVNEVLAYSSSATAIY